MRRFSFIVPALVVTVLCACGNGGGSTGGGGSAGSGNDTTTSGSGAGGLGGSGGLAGNGGFLNLGGGPTTTSNGPVTLEQAGISPDSLPAVPTIDCDPAAGTEACTLPASVCATDRWLVFYTNPQCDAGVCGWEPLALDCGADGKACIEGGCDYNFTL